MLYVFLLYALFASVFTISKTALQYSGPFFLIGTRMLLAGVILFTYQFVFNRQSLRLTKPIWMKLLQLALFNIYLTNVCEFWGLRYLTSFKTCFIYSLSPFISALFCYFLFSETLNLKKWIGLLICLIGFVPILLSQSAGEELTGQFFIFSWAAISVITAVTLSVYGWILLKQLVNEHGLSPLLVNGISMCIGGTFALVHSFAVEEWNPIPTTNVPIFLETTFFLIIISNLICYNLYGYLLKRYSAVFMSFAGLTTPLFTALFGWLFLGENVTWTFYLSFSLVVCGLWIYEQDELGKVNFLKKMQKLPNP